MKLTTALVPQAELLASAPRIRSQGWLAMEESLCMWAVLSFGTFSLQAALVNLPGPYPSSKHELASRLAKCCPASGPTLSCLLEFR